MDPAFTHTMVYDETLCLRDYILRVDEAARNELQDFSYEVKVFEGRVSAYTESGGMRCIR
ncbi:MAG: hypothetical protein ACLT16_17975 [[Clostridium] innocuum]